MATTLATILVGLGYDLSELERGSPEAFRLINQQTMQMSAEMKRQSREGAESFRLIDEALGIHVSRPLTRLIGQSATLGPLLASAFQFSAVAAMGMVLAEGAKKLFEITGATEAWKEMLGLTEQTAEEMAKSMKTGDEELIKRLREKIALQDAYNKLVLNLKDGDFEKAHLSALKQENAEIIKQMALQEAQAQEIANKPGWRTFLSDLDPRLGGLLTVFGQGQAKEMMDANIAANKLAESMKPLVDAMHQVNNEMKQDQFKVMRDDMNEAVHDFQLDASTWNAAANELWTVIGLVEKLSANRNRMSPLEGVLPPTGAPMRADQAELDKLTNPRGLESGIDQQTAGWTKAGQVLESIETPLQKYSTGLAVLKQLYTDGRISTDQFRAAQQQLGDEFNLLQDRIEKLMKERGAVGGLDAFLLQWTSSTGKNTDGQFVFSFLQKGLDGFESETVKTLTGAKTQWRSFFAELDQMALKFLLNKELTELFKMFSGTSIGKSLGLSSLLNSANPGQIANTTALAANTAAVVANTAAVVSAGISSAAGGGGISSLFDLGIPAFAGGTDYAPGGIALVGEQGPELVNLPGGSSVLPNGAMRSNSVHSPVYIDARGAQEGVAEQIARSWQQHGPPLVTRAVVEAFESQRRSIARPF